LETDALCFQIPDSVILEAFQLRETVLKPTMAIYHYSLKTISRSTGRSSVAAAAYRSGERLVDERTGNIYDYTRRDGVLHAEVFLPDGQTVGREELWNLTETAEKRKDAKVAREIVVALPHELSQLDQLTLLREYAKGLSRRTGWAVDVAMHAPGGEGDQRNTHAHILCTTRKIERNENGQLQMGSKTRDWDVIATGKDLVMAERKEWERQVNRYLEMAQSKARVDCRSYDAQGKTEQIPQIHLGVSASQMERKGIETERGDRNRDAAEHNQNVVDLKQAQHLREIKQRAAQKIEDKRRWEGMSVQELQEERRAIDVGSERMFAYRDAGVQAARIPLLGYPDYRDEQACADYKAGKFGWLNEDHRSKKEEAARRASTRQYHAKADLTRWKEKHPYKAALWEMGIPNREYSTLMNSYKQADAEDQTIQKELQTFQLEKKKAEQAVESAIRKAIFAQSSEYYRCKTRVEELDKILKPKQEQECALKREQERGRGGGRSIGF
jgi:hypothetical protein